MSVNAGFVIATVSSRSPIRNESKLAGGSGDSWGITGNSFSKSIQQLKNRTGPNEVKGDLGL